MGIEVRFVDAGNPENFRKATDARTRAYYAEALPNPMLKVFPIAEVAAISEELGVPLILDNTAAPVICRPFDHGAHIIVHSATKYIGGHANSIHRQSGVSGKSVSVRVDLGCLRHLK